MHSAALRARARTQAEMVRVDGRCAHEQTKRRVRLPKSRSSVEVSVFLKVFMAKQEGGAVTVTVSVCLYMYRSTLESHRPGDHLGPRCLSLVFDGCG